MGTEAKKGRIAEFDVARAFAIICMIAVHTEFAIYNYENEVFATVFDYLGSPFAAPAFMFILGANVFLSSKNSPKQLFTRGVSIFVSSLVFNIICHALPFFILDFKNGVACFAENALHWIFAVDILTFAGLAFMFFALAKKLKLKNVTLAVIAVVLSVANILLTANCPVDFEKNTAAAVITGLFYNSSITGYFSFCSWIIFPVAGYIFVQILVKVKNKDRFYLRLGSVSLAAYLVMVYGSFKWLPQAPLVVYTDEYSYYQMHPYGAAGTVLFCLAWISIMYFVSKILPSCLDGTVRRWNRNLTVMYYIQWFLINYCFVLASNYSFYVNEWQYILCFIGVIAAADLLAVLYKRYRAWAKAPGKAAGPAPGDKAAQASGT